MTARVIILAVAAALFGACRGPVDNPTQGAGFIEQACAGTTFDHCFEDISFAIETYPSGEQFAICDAGTGKGSVVLVATTAEEACSEDAIDPGRVVRVVTLP
jgi:hypothetical protein